jgi:hypothetical protein
MKKILIVAAFGLLSLASANAQLKGGSFGIGASFAGGNNAAQFMYAASNNLDFALLVGVTSTSVDMPDPMPDPDAVTALNFGLGLRYFLYPGDVAPYLGAMVNYSSPNEDDKTFGFSIVLGGQAWVVKNLGVFSHVGFGVDMRTVTTTTGTVSSDTKTTQLGLFTAAVGACFYF